MRLPATWRVYHELTSLFRIANRFWLIAGSRLLLLLIVGG